MNHVTHDTSLFLLTSAFFNWKSVNFAMSRHRDIDGILVSYFNFSWVFKNCFNEYGYNFDDVSKMATLGLLKVKVFWNEVYEVIISTHDVTSNILSRDSNYIVNIVMWPKFGNSNVSTKEVIITSIL